MKLIKAYIRNNKTGAVYNALKEAGFCCMTFVECEGTGRYSNPERQSTSLIFHFVNTYKVSKLEIVISDEHLINVIDNIRTNGRTGYNGDGIILVSPVDNVYKVRNNEEGMLAL